MLRQLLECGGCWNEKEGKDIGAGSANHLHTGWGVRQATGTYGCRPFTQPGEHILPSEGNFNTAVKGTNQAKLHLMDFL